jgi:hypothetical protein
MMRALQCLMSWLCRPVHTLHFHVELLGNIAVASAMHACRVFAVPVLIPSSTSLIFQLPVAIRCLVVGRVRKVVQDASELALQSTC